MNYNTGPIHLPSFLSCCAIFFCKMFLWIAKPSPTVEAVFKGLEYASVIITLLVGILKLWEMIENRFGKKKNQ